MTIDLSLVRCPWVHLDKPDYIAYHDEEWGVPVHDDRLMFEFLTLESAQAGLSWHTILRKRENYRLAFDGFDPEKVARYDEHKIGMLLKDSGLIRNRKKIEAAVNNAQRFLEIQEVFGSFDAYIWRFVDGQPIVNKIRTMEDFPAQSRESEALARDLKQRGFKFVGPVICYSHLQATGLINDHFMDCFRREDILGSYLQIA